MIKRIKNTANTEDKKRLLSNFVSLSVLQGANYILPLITLPYLVRVLGVEYFGLLAFATATVTYFSILTDYGFNLTATREISIHRDNKEKVIEIFSSVMTIKFILMFISFFLLSILVLSFEKFLKDALVYFLTFSTVVGQVLFPVWFFQGMERMKYITYLNILSKVIFTIAIFIFVQEQSDFYLVPLLTSIGFLIVGIWSLILIRKEFGIGFSLQNKKTIKKYFIDGWHVFISRIAVVLYTTSNIFILGLFTNNTVVGYYSIAEKVFSAIVSLGTIGTRVLFPYFSKIWEASKEEYYKKFYYFLKIIIILMSSIALIVLLFSSGIVMLISGENLNETSNVLKILSFAMILFPLGALFTESFITQKNNVYVTKATSYTSIVNVGLVFPLVYFYGAYGLAVTIVLVQIFQVYINTKYFLHLRKKIVCVA